MSEANKGRKQLLMMFAIAFVTMGLAYASFYYARTEGTWGTTNHGAFVDPPLQLDDLGIERFERGDTWWLLIADDRCERSCQDTLASMQSLHILLNRDARRLRRALLSDQAGAGADEHLVERPNPGSLEDGIYIADPLGNLVFFYPMETDPKLVLADLKKLLRLSQIG